MTARPPASSLIPWYWVIEALANYKEVDLLTLIGVFNRSPNITSDVGSNARDRVSFRILERLFDTDTQPIEDVQCARQSGVSFDVSEHCEDVLRHILGQMHDPNIWDESEKSKWNAEPFIAYKRSCFLKTDLGRLNDMLVQGKPSYLTLLKRTATSLHLNQHGAKNFKVNGNVSDSQLNLFIDDKVCQDTSDDGSREGEDENYMKQSSESSSSSDDEWYHEEMNDTLAKKEAFFRSKCKDREGVTRLKDASRCMKCNKGGHLLVCSFDTCSFVFHSNCLASKAPFHCDSSGKFYCPFCIHSQSISDSWVAKKKVSLERNYLASFMKRNTNRAEPQIPNKVVLLGLVNKSFESNVRERCNARNNLASFNKRNDSIAESLIPNEVANLGLGDENSESESRVSSVEGSSEGTDSMDCAVRLRKQNKPCTDLYVSRRRRVSVPWTQAEEETLKKWVHKFTGYSGIPERRFPWRKILDLAASKFQKGRTPIDLKDKWRNMVNASNKSK